MLQQLEETALKNYVRHQMSRTERVFIYLEEIRSSSGRKPSELMEKYGYSEKAVKKDLQILKKYGLIKYDGINKTYVDAERG